MRIEAERKLFVGLKIDNKLRDALAHAPHRDRAFFDGSDERYLRELRAVEETFLGKIIEPGVAVTALDDVKRNVLSILHKITNGRRNEDDIKVFALDEGEPPPLPPKDPSPYDRY